MMHRFRKISDARIAGPEAQGLDSMLCEATRPRTDLKSTNIWGIKCC